MQNSDETLVLFVEIEEIEELEAKVAPQSSSSFMDQLRAVPNSKIG